MTKEEHWKCGRYSGFPDCCILWFTTHWQELWTNHCFKAWYDKLLTVHVKYNKYGEPHYCGYVPCPSCLLKNRIVKPRRCYVGGRPHVRCGAIDGRV